MAWNAHQCVEAALVIDMDAATVRCGISLQLSLRYHREPEGTPSQIEGLEDNLTFRETRIFRKYQY